MSFAGCRMEWKSQFFEWFRSASRTFIVILEALPLRYACMRKIGACSLRFKTRAKVYLSKSNWNSLLQAGSV